MQYRDPRAAEARRLRTEEGMSSKEIQQRLGVGKNKLQYWLAGLPTSQGLRPQARDDLKAKAREMRGEGKTYPEIAEALEVSKSSVSLWVRDMPFKPRDARGWTEESRQRRSEARERKREREKAIRAVDRQCTEIQMGPFSERDILLNGAIAYWCEGSKAKPWRVGSADVAFINSDPGLVRLFLKFLSVVPVPHGGPSFRLHLHENGDEDRAKEFWCRELGIEHDVFLSTVWKRHKPKTVRKNTGDGYYGCIMVRARKCTELYWYIDNLAAVAIGGMSDAVRDWRTVI